MQHPFVSLCSVSVGTGTIMLAAAEKVGAANPDLAAVAMICGSLATIFSAIVAVRHPRKPSRGVSRRRRKPSAIPRRTPTKQ